MPQYHGLTMMKSPGPASFVNRCATRSMFVKRQFKSPGAAGMASAMVAAAKPKTAARKCRLASGRPNSKAAAARASNGRKYHGSEMSAANRRNPANPATAASNVTPANKRQIICDWRFTIYARIVIRLAIRKS